MTDSPYAMTQAEGIRKDKQRMKHTVTHEEEHPLRWPDGQPRTDFRYRIGRGGWKLTLAKTRDALRKELERSGATSSLTTYSNDPRDAGVAVYFSRTAQDQFAWQEAFGLVGVVPTKTMVEDAYRKAIRTCHPDGPTPDNERFLAITKHRDRALDYIAGRVHAEHEYVIAIDCFDEVRLNLNAVRIVLYSLRRIEDCGSPLMLERAFRGFGKQITAGEVSHGPAVVA